MHIQTWMTYRLCHLNDFLASQLHVAIGAAFTNTLGYTKMGAQLAHTCSVAGHHFSLCSTVTVLYFGKLMHDATRTWKKRDCGDYAVKNTTSQHMAVARPCEVMAMVAMAKL